MATRTIPVVRQSALVRAALAELLDVGGARSLSDCEIRCYQLPEGPERSECLDECEQAAAVAAVAAKLKVDLLESFIEVIWSGGDIDPVPLEEAVRRRFAERRPERARGKR
jgi:hypothetical protein